MKLALRLGVRKESVQAKPTDSAVSPRGGELLALDQTYGALGTYVAEREWVEGPIRGSYLVAPWDTDDESAHRTEVGWPIFQTTSAGRAGA